MSTLEIVSSPTCAAALIAQLHDLPHQLVQTIPFSGSRLYLTMPERAEPLAGAVYPLAAIHRLAGPGHVSATEGHVDYQYLEMKCHAT